MYVSGVIRFYAAQARKVPSIVFRIFGEKTCAEEGLEVLLGCSSLGFGV